MAMAFTIRDKSIDTCQIEGDGGGRTQVRKAPFPHFRAVCPTVGDRYISVLKHTPDYDRNSKSPPEGNEGRGQSYMNMNCQSEKTLERRILIRT